MSSHAHPPCHPPHPTPIPYTHTHTLPRLVNKPLGMGVGGGIGLLGEMKVGTCYAVQSVSVRCEWQESITIALRWIASSGGSQRAGYKKSEVEWKIHHSSGAAV